LEIRVLGLIIPHSYLNSLVGDLDHFKILLHLLLQHCMVQHYGSSFMQSSQKMQTSSPMNLEHRASLSFNGWECFPPFTIYRTFGSELLLFPHYDVSIFSAARNDALFLIILNGDNLVVEKLTLKSRL
jgi:hypothetical protein